MSVSTLFVCERETAAGVDYVVIQPVRAFAGLILQ